MSVHRSGRKKTWVGGPKATLARLREKGFDESRVVPNQGVHVGCSQCAALAVNGVPCHETGCPNQVGECRGCGEIVPRGVRYCGDCS